MFRIFPRILFVFIKKKRVFKLVYFTQSLNPKTFNFFCLTFKSNNHYVYFIETTSISVSQNNSSLEKSKICELINSIFKPNEMNNTDDTIIIQSSSSSHVLRNGLEQELEELGSWFYKNKLIVNTSKTEVIFFGKSNTVEQYKNDIFQKEVLESKDKVKYSGVMFEEDMSWSKQVNEIRKYICTCISLQSS